MSKKNEELPKGSSSFLDKVLWNKGEVQMVKHFCPKVGGCSTFEHRTLPQPLQPLLIRARKGVEQEAATELRRIIRETKETLDDLPLDGVITLGITKGKPVQEGTLVTHLIDAVKPAETALHRFEALAAVIAERHTRITFLVSLDLRTLLTKFAEPQKPSP